MKDQKYKLEIKIKNEIKKIQKDKQQEIIDSPN